VAQLPDLPSGFLTTGIASADGSLFAIGYDGDITHVAKLSSGASAWVSLHATEIAGETFHTIEAHGDNIVCVGYRSADNDIAVLYSTNGGTSWATTSLSVPGSAESHALIVLNGRFVVYTAGAYPNDVIYTATNPSSWSAATGLPVEPFAAILNPMTPIAKWSGGLAAFLQQPYGGWTTSVDGQTWSHGSGWNYSSFYGCAWHQGSSRWIAVADVYSAGVALISFTSHAALMDGTFETLAWPVGFTVPTTQGSDGLAYVYGTGSSVVLFNMFDVHEAGGAFVYSGEGEWENIDPGEGVWFFFSPGDSDIGMADAISRSVYTYGVTTEEPEVPDEPETIACEISGAYKVGGAVLVGVPVDVQLSGAYSVRGAVASNTINSVVLGGRYFAAAGDRRTQPTIESARGEIAFVTPTIGRY